MAAEESTNPYSAEALQSSPPPKTKRRWTWLTLLLAAAVGVGFGIWWSVRPHSAEDQFAKAEQLQQRLVTEGPNLPAEKRAKLLNKTLDAYQRVFTKFEAEPDLAGRAHLRIAELHEAEGDAEAARQWLRTLIDRGGADPPTRQAFERLSDSLSSAGQYREAIGVLDDFLARFGSDDPEADNAAMERCRILQDSLAPPWAEPIEALRAFLDEYPESEFLDEALLRLGRIHEHIGEYATAGEYFQRLIDEYPDSEHLLSAEKGRARCLARIDPEAGEQAWRELAEKYADDPDVLREAQAEADRLAGQIEQAREAEQAEQAAGEAQEYETQRYGGGGVGGGGGGFADQFGKPVPPQEMLRDFIEQQVDAEHYVIEVTLNPADHTIESSGRVELVNRGDDKDNFLLMLGAVLTPGEFTFNGQTVRVRRPPGKAEVIQVLLDEPWAAGAAGTLTYAFTGQAPPLPELPESMKQQILEQFSRGDGPEIFLAQPTTTPAEPEAQTQSGPDEDQSEEPFNPMAYLANPSLQLQINDTGYALSGAAWYPITIFGDVFTAEIDMTLLGEQELVCSGLAEGNELTDGARRTRWVCQKPYFGLYFAYGPYEVIERQYNGLPLRGYFLPEQMELGEGYLDTAEDVLDLYSERFGPFAFEKMSVIQVDLPPILGGVGPAGMVFLHSYVISNSDHVLSNLLAHELAHQWWGNLVPINMLDSDWNQWLSEGFATYSDALYTEHADGDETFVEHIDKIADLYLTQSAGMREEPLSQTFMDQSPLYRPVVYEKGALVLHALRYVLGDEAFFRVLREYADTYAFELSTVSDFRHLASEAGGENLDWFFDEWLDRAGCPYFEIDHVTVEPGEGESYRVTVRIAQPEQLSRMPMDVQVLGPAGQEHIERAELGRKENTVVIEVGFPVESVRLDPDGWVLQRGGPNETQWRAESPAGN